MSKTAYVAGLTVTFAVLTSLAIKFTRERSKKFSTRELQEQVLEMKPSRKSHIEMTEVLHPNQADIYGVAFSGVLMSWIDVCAGLAAKTHADRPCVTASVDAVHFLRPLYLGDIVIIRARVNRSWNTSMEVGVSVHAENITTGKRRYCCQAYLTFVGLVDGKPSTVPILLPETDLEKEEYELADKRRLERIQSRNQKSELSLQLFKDYEIQEDSSSEEIIPMAAFQIETSPSLSNFNHSPESNVGSSISNRASYHSYTQNVALIMPQHANSIGITFGGYIIKMMEQCALISASRHVHALHQSTDYQIVFRAASIDTLTFMKSTKVGDIICIRAHVSRVWKSSVEVYITVHAHSLGYSSTEKPSSRRTWEFTNDGYMTFFAVENAKSENHNELHDEDFSLLQSPLISRLESTVRKTEELPAVIPNTAEEKERYFQAESRRKKRLQQRDHLLRKLSLVPRQFG